MKMFYSGKTRMIGLPYGEKNCDIMLSRFHPIPERYGQKDRIATSISRVSVLTRDKKYCKTDNDLISLQCGTTFYNTYDTNGFIILLTVWCIFPPNLVQMSILRPEIAFTKFNVAAVRNLGFVAAAVGPPTKAHIWRVPPVKISS